jgi:hypothetical protein
MIEVLAAVAGAAITATAMGLGGFSKRNDEARIAVIRLTTSVEHIATQLEVIHTDMRDANRETFSHLNLVEQRLAKLEAAPSWDGNDRRSN